MYRLGLLGFKFAEAGLLMRNSISQSIALRAMGGGLRSILLNLVVHGRYTRWLREVLESRGKLIVLSRESSGIAHLELAQIE